MIGVIYFPDPRLIMLLRLKTLVNIINIAGRYCVYFLIYNFVCPFLKKTNGKSYNKTNKETHCE